MSILRRDFLSFLLGSFASFIPLIGGKHGSAHVRSPNRRCSLCRDRPEHVLHCVPAVSLQDNSRGDHRPDPPRTNGDSGKPCPKCGCEPKATEITEVFVFPVLCPQCGGDSELGHWILGVDIRRCRKCDYRFTPGRGAGFTSMTWRPRSTSPTRR